jgi:hypothetical protein
VYGPKQIRPYFLQAEEAPFTDLPGLLLGVLFQTDPELLYTRPAFVSLLLFFFPGLLLAIALFRRIQSAAA